MQSNEMELEDELSLSPLSLHSLQHFSSLAVFHLSSQFVIHTYPLLSRSVKPAEMQRLRGEKQGQTYNKFLDVLQSQMFHSYEHFFQFWWKETNILSERSSTQSLHNSKWIWEFAPKRFSHINLTFRIVCGVRKFASSRLRICPQEILSYLQFFEYLMNKSMIRFLCCSDLTKKRFKCISNRSSSSCMTEPKKGNNEIVRRERERGQRWLEH